MRYVSHAGGTATLLRTSAAGSLARRAVGKTAHRATCNMVTQQRDHATLRLKLRSLAGYFGGNPSGIHGGRSAIEARAFSDVGTPHAWKNGPRLRPTARENRAIH